MQSPSSSLLLHCPKLNSLFILSSVQCRHPSFATRSHSLFGGFSRIWKKPSLWRRETSYRITMTLMPFEGAFYQNELEAAIHAVERACCLCGIVYGASIENGKEHLKKNDHSPVTIADFGVQSLVSMELGSLFPSVPLIGEEDSGFLRMQLSGIKGSEAISKYSLVDEVVLAVSAVASSGVGPVNSHTVLEAIDKGSKNLSIQKDTTYWVLDPIDGTRGFLKGGDALYVVGLALVVQGKLVLGVMGCPRLTYGNLSFSKSGKRLLHSISKILGQEKEKWWIKDGIIMAAYRGCGCWIRPLTLESRFIKQELEAKSLLNNFVQSSVDGCANLSSAWFGLSCNEDMDSYPLAQSMGLSTSNELTVNWTQTVIHLCCGSLCKYFAVAIGAVSVVLLHQAVGKHVKVWDHAAGVICVLEAGGKVTDIKDLDIETSMCNGDRTFVPEGGQIIVTNVQLHLRVLQALRDY